MADKKAIAVVGATGAQGGGLVRAILADPNGGFACRAITRDPSKDQARALAGKGAEVVKADLDDVDSLKTPPFHEPFLTTVYDPNFEMGQRAAELLLAQVEEGVEPQSVVLSTRLVIRRSCGACQAPPASHFSQKEVCR